MRRVKDLDLKRFYIDGTLRIPNIVDADSDVVVIEESPAKKLKKPTTSPYFQNDSNLPPKLDLPLLAKTNKPTVDDAIYEGIKKRYTFWKKARVFTYDYFTNHNIDENPCYSLEFGDITNETTNNFTQQFYYVEYDSAINQSYINVNDIVISKAKHGKLPKEFSEDDPSPYITRTKSVHVQGKVKLLRKSPIELEPLIATLPDKSTSVSLWYPDNKVTLQSSKGREPNGILKSKVDTIRTFAWSSTDRKIVTATDREVCVWSIAGMSPKEYGVQKLTPQTTFYGEGARVSGVSVGVANDSLYCTSSHDRFIRIYDERAGRKHTSKINAHSSAMTCIDWNKLNEYLIASGDTDGNWKIFDTRLISTDKSRETTSQQLDSSISSIQWSPNKEDVLGVSSSYKITIYKKHREHFKHKGHRYTVDDWRWNANSEDGSEIASVATDVEGGGTLQVWRPGSLDLYQMSVENVEAFLELSEDDE